MKSKSKKNSVCYKNLSLGNYSQDILNVKKEDIKETSVNNSQNFTTAMESSIDGIAILDKSGYFTFLNQSYIDIYGYDSKSELLSKSWEILYDKREIRRFESKVFPELNNTGTWRGEVIGKRKDNSKFYQELTLTALENDGCLCAVRDITDKISAQKDIEMSQKRYQSLFENAPNLIILVNPKSGRIIDFNKNSYKALEYSKNDFSDMYITDIETLETQDFIFRRIRSIISKGYLEFETNLQTKKGEIRDFKINAKSISLDSRKYIQFICNDVTNLKKQNLELIESEAKYKALIEKSQDGIFIYNNERCIYHNDRLLEIIGYTSQEIYNMDPINLFYEKEKERIIEHIKKHKHMRIESHFFESIMINKDNNIINVEIGISIVPYKRDLAALFTIRDITNRRHIENIYKSLVENSFQGLLIFQDNKIVFTNEKASEITGYSVDELLSFSFKDIIKMCYQEDFKDLKNLLNSLKLENIPTQYFRLRIITKSGDIKWVENVVTFIEYNNKPALYGAYLDITDKKKAEDALVDAQQQYKILIENAFDAIYLLNDYNFEYVNPQLCELTGYSYEELTMPSFTFDMILTEKAKKIIEKRFRDIKLNKDIPNKFELEVISKSKRIIQVEITTVVLGQEPKLSILGIMRNITDRKRIEDEMRDLVVALHISKDLTEERAKEIEILNQQLKESELQLKELNISKDKFFSIIAHDLKGPFSGFLGLTKILSQDIQSLSIEDLQDITKDLYDSANHLFRLLENLLQWSRLQRKAVQYNPEKLNIYDLVELNFNLLKQNAKLKTIALINDLDSKTELMADANMINTILRNLISNAIKFTYEKGSITIKGKKLNQKYFEISIVDTGMGMDKESQNKIFQIDSQHTTLGTNQEKGTGLGLILCKELVEIHKGNISVESVLEKGTTFKFTLPIFIDQIDLNTD